MQLTLHFLAAEFAWHNHLWAFLAVMTVEVPVFHPDMAKKCR
jgi:hypothetical protein